ncbi:MAG: arylsulfatase [Pirellulaceae bacterium]|nr:arylsulfatase [Pirellulaceae bacterium]
MIRRLVFWLPCLALVVSPGSWADATEPPSIVIILADDMGYSDLGCYGGEIETPQLDALARGGLRFTQFHNTARCCPTRASLLTGVYPHQADVGGMVDDQHVPGYRGRLNPDTPTIAEILGGGGYRTFMIGKWHVSPFDYATREARDPASWPIHRGFTHVYGTLTGGGSYFDPRGLMRDDRFIAPEPREGYYYTDAISDEAARYIHDHAERKTPLFMYVAYTAPHWPLHARPRAIAKYRTRYRKGWDELRAERLARMKSLDIVDDRYRLTERDARVGPWRDEQHKEWQVERMAVYAAQVDAMDQGIGRIVEALRSTGRLENTLILFLADNGGCDEAVHARSTKHRKNYYHYPVDDLMAGNVPDRMPGPRDTFASYGVGWANLSNTPFRLYKQKIHAGGIATPLIVHWPRGIHDKGALRRQPGHVIDLLPTCLDVAGVPFPAEFNGKTPISAEGISLRPALDDKPLPERLIFWEHMGNAGVRQGEWKLVREKNKPWELYNLEQDPTEMVDLAERESRRVADMEAAYQRWARRANVIKPEA